MIIRYINYGYSIIKGFVKRVYLESFPKDERFPFWILTACSRESNVHLQGILVDDKPVGMQFSVNYDDITYLMYFAIDKTFRGKGFGSQSLRNWVARYNNVLLCIERPVDSETVRRKTFYLNNGFYSTGCIIEDNGVEYEFLSTEKGYKPKEEILKDRYKYMSSSPFIRFVISHIFNTKSINYVN